MVGRAFQHGVAFTGGVADPRAWKINLKLVIELRSLLYCVHH